MLLYVLVFKSEPLIKVGISREPGARWSQLGDARFDFTRSYLVRAKNPEHIRLLERNLKVLFAGQRRATQTALSSGNTEVFCGAALPKVLQLIESSQRSWPEAELCVQQGIGSAVSREPRLKSTSLTHEERLASLAETSRRKVLETIAENRQKITELKRLALAIRFLSAAVEQDNKFRYALAVKLENTDATAVCSLIKASRMYTCAYQPRISRNGRLYRFSRDGTSYGFECLSEPLNSKVCTLNILFDLVVLGRVQTESIEPDPTVGEALAFWKGLAGRLAHGQTGVSITA